MTKHSIKVTEAIEVIEQAGGLVIMEDDLYDDIKIRENEEDRKKHLQELKNKRLEALEDFDKMLGSKNFSVSAVEDMVHGHGLDLDDLEDMIHKFY